MFIYTGEYIIKMMFNIDKSVGSFFFAFFHGLNKKREFTTMSYIKILSLILYSIFKKKKDKFNKF